VTPQRYPEIASTDDKLELYTAKTGTKVCLPLPPKVLLERQIQGENRDGSLATDSPGAIR
jgi:hypothetical protein